MSGDTKKATKAASAADILKHAGGSESDAWNNYIGAQALASIRPYIGDEEKRDKMRAIVTAGLTGIAPRDEMEGMIAAQMLACHDTAMGCFRDALNSKLHGRLWHEYLEQAGKLSRTFSMLLDALNRHRGKGQQKITVEHVHVHTGGQAVLGVVEAPGGGVQPKIGGSSPCKGYRRQGPGFGSDGGRRRRGGVSAPLQTRRERTRRASLSASNMSLWTDAFAAPSVFHVKRTSARVKTMR